MLIIACVATLYCYPKWCQRVKQSIMKAFIAAPYWAPGCMKCGVVVAVYLWAPAGQPVFRWPLPWWWVHLRGRTRRHVPSLRCSRLMSAHGSWESTHTHTYKYTSRQRLSKSETKDRFTLIRCQIHCKIDLKQGSRTTKSSSKWTTRVVFRDIKCQICFQVFFAYQWLVRFDLPITLYGRWWSHLCFFLMSVKICTCSAPICLRYLSKSPAQAFRRPSSATWEKTKPSALMKSTPGTKQ